MGSLLSAAIILEFFLFPFYFSQGFFHQSRHAQPTRFMSMKVTEDRRIPGSSKIQRKRSNIPPEIYNDIVDNETNLGAENDVIMEEWEGYMEGFDWQLERARMFFEGPAFAPIRMTLWEPVLTIDKSPKPTFLNQMKILLNNALQMAGLAESMDGAPLVQIVSTFKGSFLQLLSRVADGNLAELAGGPLFLLLQDYYKQYGPVFKLAFGPKSFIVVSDPIMVKHILKDNPLNYDKGILAEILDPIMGKGLIPADPETWKVRRKAIVPGFHKAWLNAMMDLFVDCNQPLIAKMQKACDEQAKLNMETEFCSVSLDIIGKAVFNYDFGSVSKESPVVKAVYRALQEAEYRSTSFIPYWNLPFARYYLKNLQEFEKNMDFLNNVLNELITKALATQNKADIEELEQRDYKDNENTSLLRFLVDMRGEESTSHQLRDDLMTMLIAGHETTAAVLTWTFYELAKNPELYRRVQEEIDTVLQGRSPQYDDMIKLSLVRLCLAETLRMYPEPPLLIRRALGDDILPKGGAAKETFIPRGTDIFIATWNIHRSPDFWEKPEEYWPERFLKNFTNPTQESWAGYRPAGSKQLYPNEVHSDFAFLPFGGGSRKCVGDQFAMMESITTIALILQRFEVELATHPDKVGMRTGATIHTENGLMMKIKQRSHRKTTATESSSEIVNSHHHNMHSSHHAPIAAPIASHVVDSGSPAAAASGGCPFHAVGTATVMATATSIIDSSSSVSSSINGAGAAKCPFNVDDQDSSSAQDIPVAGNIELVR